MAELTVFCPFTRLWCVEPFFRALGESDVPFGEARFVAYIDSLDPSLGDAVKARARRLGFVDTVVAFSGRPAPEDGVGARRRRPGHAVMRRASQALVGEGPLLLLEDDTLIPPETYGPLAETLAICDWVVGAEVGRWGVTCPGVWRVATEDGRPSFVEAMMPAPEQLTERADATGFYCVLTSGRVYRQIDFGRWDDAMGVDVYVTWKLTAAGRALMVDWRVPCVHLTPTGRLTMDQARPFARPLKHRLGGRHVHV